MRMPGIGGAAMSAVGATVINLPGSEVAQAFASGTVDWVEWNNPYGEASMGFHRYGKYYYTPGFHEPNTSLDLFINPTAWDSLSSDLQAIVRQCAYSTTHNVLAEFTARSAPILQDLIQNEGVIIKVIPDEALVKIGNAVGEIIADQVANDASSAKIFANMSKFRNEQIVLQRFYGRRISASPKLALQFSHPSTQSSCLGTIFKRLCRGLILSEHIESMQPDNSDRLGSRAYSTNGVELPLSGVKVIEICQIAAGPFCGMLLGDLGADVIKIEPPNGDAMRQWPPISGGFSENFASVNRNKRAIVLDLKSPEHLQTALELVRQADVLLENNRPGVMDRLGLGYEAVSTICPELIYCSISAFGQTGPRSHEGAFDVTMQAISGIMSVHWRRRRTSGEVWSAAQ